MENKTNLRLSSHAQLKNLFKFLTTASSFLCVTLCLVTEKGLFNAYQGKLVFLFELAQVIEPYCSFHCLSGRSLIALPYNTQMPIILMYITFVLIFPNPTDTYYQGAGVIGTVFCFVKVFCFFLLI